MTDIAVVGISQGMKLDDFDTLDFAYAPPLLHGHSSLCHRCYILENKIDGVLDP